MEKETDLFSTNEIAEFLGVSPSSIQRWAESGKLKCYVSEGGHRKFSVDQLTEFATTYNISIRFLESMILRNEKQQNVKMKKISVL